LLLIRSSLLLKQAPRGLDFSSVLTMKISVPGNKYPDSRALAHFYQEVIERVHALPGLVSVSAINFPPMALQATVYPVHIEDPARTSPDKPLPAKYALIDPDYFQTLKIPLLSGRPFTADDADENHGVAILSATAARRFWPDSDPIGRHIQPDFPQQKLFWIPDSRNLPLTVIGVVGDIRENGATPPPFESPLIYLPYLQNPSPVMHLVVRTSSDPLRSANLVRSQVWAVDKDQPVADIGTLEDIVDYKFVDERVTADLVTVF